MVVWSMVLRTYTQYTLVTLVWCVFIGRSFSVLPTALQSTKIYTCTMSVAYKLSVVNAIHHMGCERTHTICEWMNGTHDLPVWTKRAHDDTASTNINNKMKQNTIFDIYVGIYMSFVRSFVDLSDSAGQHLTHSILELWCDKLLLFFG